MTLERVLLIRHGETDWNVAGRGQGFARTDLNANGRSQALALAAYLAGRPIRSIYSSDLPRTVQTAMPLAEQLSLKIQYDERWREINLGIFEGLTRAEALQQYPQEAAARLADYMHYVLPKGESRRQLQDRAYAAWQTLTDQAAGPEAVVVSHGGTLQMLLRKLFSDDERLNGGLTNTSITTLQRVGQHWDLIGMAETPHLSA